MVNRKRPIHSQFMTKWWTSHPKCKKPHFCKDCKKELSLYNNSTRCHSCAGKERMKNINSSGKNNSNYGKKWNLQQRKKQSLIMQEIFQKTPNLKFIVTKKANESTRILWKNHKYKKERLAKIISIKIKYGKTLLRSRLEFRFAKLLRKIHIHWRYEPKTFDLKIGSYTPDFYLPEIDTYIEIKGNYLIRKESLIKYKIFKQQKNFLIIKELKIKQLERLFL